MPDDLATYFLKEGGILGAIIVALVSALIVLWRDNKKLLKDLLDFAEARRIEDKKSLTDTLVILQENSQSNRVLAEKIEAAKYNDRRLR